MKNILSILIVFLFLVGCSTPPKPKTIAIQTLSGFPDDIIDSVKQSIEDYYKFKTVVYENIEIPSEFYTNIKSPRYRADSIIHFLKINKADSIDHIIGLTTKDISTTKYSDNGQIKFPESKYKDWGIFGLGYRPGTSCVISIYRLKHPNMETYMERIKKVTLHELGHNLGLTHCNDPHCFMRDAAETIKTIDLVELNLCEKCLSKI
ncbi:MAG: matrixin family metalloprotease [Flavobacteriales bacterium]|nr:matrixin family metalloprotease [Flavobacteriales bacterium]